MNNFGRPQVLSQFAPRSVELGAIGPIGLRPALYMYMYKGLALSQLDQLLPIVPGALFYRPWCKLTENLTD